MLTFSILLPRTNSLPCLCYFLQDITEKYECAKLFYIYTTIIFGRVSRRTSLLASIDCGALQEQYRDSALRLYSAAQSTSDTYKHLVYEKMAVLDGGCTVLPTVATRLLFNPEEM
jgi:hypothetical protein